MTRTITGLRRGESLVGRSGLRLTHTLNMLNMSGQANKVAFVLNTIHPSLSLLSVLLCRREGNTAQVVAAFAWKLDVFGSQAAFAFASCLFLFRAGTLRPFRLCWHNVGSSYRSRLGVGKSCKRRGENSKEIDTPSLARLLAGYMCNWNKRAER